MTIRQRLTFLGIILFFGFLNIFAYYCKPLSDLLNNIILSVTAIIIFWYTYETSKIRKANLIISDYNDLLLKKSRKPVVSFAIEMVKDQLKDTIFTIINLSDFPVAARIRCNFKINDIPITDVWPSYDGKEFWNLQYKELKQGVFCWIDLLEKGNYLSNEKAKSLKQEGYDEIRNYFMVLEGPQRIEPKLTIDLEVYSFNEFGEDAYYPPAYYEFDLWRLVWIPRITSEKPIWEYDSKPSWTK